MSSRPVLGVDVGGTFTDLVTSGVDGIQVAKVPSTPDDQAEGILTGVEQLDVDLPDLARFAHGTTVATNTVLERDGARTVLVTTAGFRDLLTIGRQDRPHLYRLDARRPDPVIASRQVVEVVERVGSDGEIVTELTDAEVERVVAAVRDLSPEAIAISLLFGFMVPDHERRLHEALTSLDVPITVASDLLPVLREVERTSTAALNAYVAPRMQRYLGSLERRLGSAGLIPDVEVMRSGGGTFTTRIAVREPVHTLLSGPAAGAWGAAALGTAAGVDDLVALDVGGTSTDVTLITGGRPATTADGQVGGLPFAVTTTDIHTIGAGGGSLAWRDAGGALRVGPRSAGAVPGPACYGRGGTSPTVTDANVVLGRLDPEVRLGGAMALRDDLARAAVQRVAEELNLDVMTCAEGIVRVTDAQMAKALRVVSVERGHDPRRLALVAFGGAGPLHQAALAAELGCAQVLVPPNPGVLSALGLLAAPVTVDRARTRLTTGAELRANQLAAGWDELEAEARAAIAEQDVEVASIRRTADLRYRGQAFELEVPAPDGSSGTDRDHLPEPTDRAHLPEPTDRAHLPEPTDRAHLPEPTDRAHLPEPTDPGALIDAFHEAHLERYGYDQRTEEVELVTLRCRAEGPAPELPLPRLTGGGSADAAELARREVVADTGRVTARILDRSRLGSGATIDGPAIVLGLDATVWVAPWQLGEVDDLGILVLTER
jgi:N-methylhydantoinase A